jgi:dienelactone hydrolase
LLRCQFAYGQYSVELPAVCRRRGTGLALEQPTKEGQILVADLDANLIDVGTLRLDEPAIKVYPGAVHSFDIGGLPRPYLDHMIGANPEAAADSFAMTQAFLDAQLKVK